MSVISLLTALWLFCLLFALKPHAGKSRMGVDETVVLADSASRMFLKALASPYTGTNIL
jgi:hypothetical protein